MNKINERMQNIMKRYSVKFVIFYQIVSGYLRLKREIVLQEYISHLLLLQEFSWKHKYLEFLDLNSMVDSNQDILRY